MGDTGSTMLLGFLIIGILATALGVGLVVGFEFARRWARRTDRDVLAVLFILLELGGIYIAGFGVVALVGLFT